MYWVHFTLVSFSLGCLVEADIEVKLIVYLIFLFIDLWGLTLSALLWSLSYFLIFSLLKINASFQAINEH